MTPYGAPSCAHCGINLPVLRAVWVARSVDVEWGDLACCRAGRLTSIIPSIVVTCSDGELFTLPGSSRKAAERARV